MGSSKPHLSCPVLSETKHSNFDCGGLNNKVLEKSLLSHIIRYDPIFSFLFRFIYFYLFVFGCTASLLLRLSLVAAHPGYSSLHCSSARASHCGRFSYCGAWAVGMWASVVVADGA